MSWLSVNLSLDTAEIEVFSDTLLEFGALAIDFDAGSDLLRALFRAEANVSRALEDAARASGVLLRPGYTVEEVAGQDWVRHTQAQFQPIEITSRLHIVPSWCTPRDSGAAIVRLDPGLAFGTGSHATTRLCLRWLARTITGGETVVDYGCGSGILAISALKLGARSAIGIDVDEQALCVARDNARQNDVAARFRFPGQYPPVEADIVVANILLRPLIELAPTIAAMAASRIALAGILAAECDELIDCYAEWFAMETGEIDEGWALIEGTRG